MTIFADNKKSLRVSLKKELKLKSANHINCQPPETKGLRLTGKIWFASQKYLFYAA